ncbi:MATE family efflux transporter [Ciceribacter sp. L1K22]|uniref:MATE family efflux transporter n=1 Tax=Ciceribacter sp. L1K22 TaxID=2820275 RepID=UPI001ABDD1DC|nr:MATE family efflux transporter [Ciceribacter sp. L1K22]MBO3761489.1 hypothetical protein [Ciceribacter sp. L1K22]
MDNRKELSAIAGIAAPLAVTQLSQLVMGLAASFVLGRIDGAALAAGGLCAIVIQLLTVVSQGFISGAHPLMAAARGRRDATVDGGGDGGMARSFGGGVATAAICAIVATALLSRLPTLLGVFPLEAAVMRGVDDFLRAGTFAIPAIFWIIPIRFYFSVCGRAWIVMTAIAIGAGLYLGLLNLLVFGGAGIAPRGIAGAGQAFAISWWAIAVGLTLASLFSGFLPVAMLREARQGALRALPQVWSIGWPIGLIYAAELGLTLAMTLLVSKFGTVAIIANQIAHTINSIAFNPVVALGQAATVRVAYHAGAGQPVAARKAGNLALSLAVGLMAGLGLLIFVGARHIVPVFLDRNAAEYAAVETLTHHLLLILAAFLVFDGLQSVANGALRGLRDTRLPMLIGLGGYWLLAVPVAVLLAFSFGLGAIGIWIGILIGITGVGALLLLRWRRLTTDAGLPVTVPSALEAA